MLTLKNFRCVNQQTNILRYSYV